MSFVKMTLNWGPGGSDLSTVGELGEAVTVRRLASVANLGSASGNLSRLHVFKGTLPSQADIDGFQFVTGSIESLSGTRLADQLIDPITSLNQSNSYITGKTTYPFSLSSPAKQSGTLSWFALELIGVNSNTYKPTYPNIIIGSIGVAGSAADMIVEDLTITEGTRYQFPQIVIPGMPGIFNF